MSFEGLWGGEEGVVCGLRRFVLRTWNFGALAKKANKLAYNVLRELVFTAFKHQLLILKR